tara:strand:+ start:72 stop:572 length:501 start_codon:yes stop_codon:yes gene_type:complete
MDAAWQKRIWPKRVQWTLSDLTKHELETLAIADFVEAGMSDIKARETYALLHDTTTVYIVEALLDQKQVDGMPYFLVKWQGYSISVNTWEPGCNLPFAMVNDFTAANPTPKGCTALHCIHLAENKTTVCFRHGAYGFCKVDGCNTVAKRRGVCFRHGASSLPFLSF